MVWGSSRKITPSESEGGGDVIGDDFKKAALEAAYKSADAALKAVITINAGAAAAFLSFIGAGRASGAAPVIWFAIGMVAGASGMILAYGANYGTFRDSFYEEKWWKEWGPVFGWIAFGCAVAAVLAFAVGAGHVWWKYVWMAPSA
jgi:hypothetical protein